MYSIITQQLKELAEPEYAAFQAKLVPVVESQKILGVRVPLIRKLAVSLPSDQCAQFLNTLPHYYYDENCLHACLIEIIRDFDGVIAELDRFLPFVDNWAVCDIMSPRALGKDKHRLSAKISQWISSEHTYTVRFALGMLMKHFLDVDFRPEYLNLAAAVESDDYYINMMQAWFFATALAKQYEAALPYLTEKRLPVFTHNKTIQKAVDSRRISPEQTAFLKTLRIKRS